MKRVTLFVIYFLTLHCTLSAYEGVQSLVKDVAKNEKNHVFVVAHRGDWRSAPENSLQAFQNCINMGVDMIELDLKQTKDGHLIIMHDKTIDRTTNGKGLPSDYTLEELKNLRLKNGLGRITPHTIPTLYEVLLLCKDKIYINIDKGYDYFEEVLQLLEQTGSANQVVIKSGHSLEKVRIENKEVLERVVYMPIINLDKEGAEEQIDQYLTISPLAIECCFEVVTDEVIRLLEKIRNSTSEIWINSLWPSLNGGHDDDRAVEEEEKEESWGWIVEQGTRFVQTDRPLELIEFLTQKGMH